jgi:hypothetical protein
VGCGGGRRGAQRRSDIDGFAHALPHGRAMTAGTRCADACYTPNTATIQSCEIVRSEPRRKRSCGVREPAKREVHARHVTPLQRYVTHMGVNDAATTRAATTMIVYGDGTHGSGRDGQMHTRQGRVELRPSTGKRAGEKGLDGRLRGGDATRRDTRIHTQRQRRASDARGTHQRVWRRASTAVPCTRRGVHFLFVNDHDRDSYIGFCESGRRKNDQWQAKKKKQRTHARTRCTAATTRARKEHISVVTSQTNTGIIQRDARHSRRGPSSPSASAQSSACGQRQRGGRSAAHRPR